MAHRLLFISMDKPTGSVWNAFSNLARRHQTRHNFPPCAQGLTATERFHLMTYSKRLTHMELGCTRSLKQ